MSAARETVEREASGSRVLGLREARRFKCNASIGSDCRSRDGRMLPPSCCAQRRRTFAACARACASWAGASRRVSRYRDGEDQTVHEAQRVLNLRTGRLKTLEECPEHWIRTVQCLGTQPPLELGLIGFLRDSRLKIRGSVGLVNRGKPQRVREKFGFFGTEWNRNRVGGGRKLLKTWCRGAGLHPTSRSILTVEFQIKIAA